MDLLLIIGLVVAVPAHALYQSFTGPQRRAVEGGAKYLASTSLPLVLLASVITLWVWSRRPFELLGLDWPISLSGKAAIAVAVILLSALALATMLQKPVSDLGSLEAHRKFLPRSGRELPAFIVFAFAVGVSWEILYRGYLFWALEPSIGTIGVIAVSATAYGLAHGYRDQKSLFGSLVMALAFALAYALTRSLWWLMLLHTGLPLIGGSAMRLASRRTARI